MDPDNIPLLRFMRCDLCGNPLLKDGERAERRCAACAEVVEEQSDARAFRAGVRRMPWAVTPVQAREIEEASGRMVLRFRRIHKEQRTGKHPWRAP